MPIFEAINRQKCFVEYFGLERSNNPKSLKYAHIVYSSERHEHRTQGCTSAGHGARQGREREINVAIP
jgi:hypothetical protein